MITGHKAIHRAGRALLLFIAAFCNAASGSTAGADELFAGIEKTLLQADSVRVEFTISSEGAIASSVQGSLLLVPRANQVRLDLSGTFAAASVDLSLVSDGKRMRGGPKTKSFRADKRYFESETPTALGEAIVIGLTRMGLLHNIAMLTGGVPPDHSDRAVTEWIACSKFLLDETARDGDGDRAPLTFDIAVSGKHVAEGKLWIDAETGLPVRREQTVHFGSSTMRAVESYTVFEIGGEIDPGCFEMSSPEGAPRLAPPPEEVIAAFGLDPFYKKYVNAGGLPVVASERVSDYALLEAAYLIGRMLQNRDDILQALAENKTRFVVMAFDELTTMIPEHGDLEPARFWDKRARGLGATPARPAVSCGEENLLGYRGDPYEKENILIHEFAHAIHHMGLVTVDEEFDGRLDGLYRKAMAKGLWKNKYAANNLAEYWAEGVQSWFDTNRPPDHDHNHVDRREELEEYDPDLAALIAEVLGEIEWRYTKPAARKEPAHLTGYDPAAAPRFAWPPELVEWYKQYEAEQKAKAGKSNKRK